MGEMEVHCAISHGASSFTYDRLVRNSDYFEIYVCDDCGNTVVAKLTQRRFHCQRCDQNTRISKIAIPYAFKLLQQELMSTGIGIWFEVKKDPAVAALEEHQQFDHVAGVAVALNTSTGESYGLAE